MGRPKGSKNKPKNVELSLRKTLNKVLKNRVDLFNSSSGESTTVTSLVSVIENDLLPLLTEVPQIHAVAEGSKVSASFIYKDIKFQYTKGE